MMGKTVIVKPLQRQQPTEIRSELPVPLEQISQRKKKLFLLSALVLVLTVLILIVAAMYIYKNHPEKIPAQMGFLINKLKNKRKD